MSDCSEDEDRPSVDDMEFPVDLTVGRGVEDVGDATDAEHDEPDEVEELEDRETLVLFKA